LKEINIQAILWDLDGTLVSTADLHFRASQTTLIKYGYHIERPVFDASFGMSDYTILGNAAPDMEDTSFQAMVAEKNALYRALLQQDELLPLPGVVSWLEFFKQRGLRQVIASTTFEENIRTITARLEIASYFEGIISTIKLNLPSKPHPHVFLKAAEFLNLAPQNCLVIEDAPAGIEAARRAGMLCLAVGTSNPLPKLAAASLVVASLDILQVEQIEQLLNLPASAAL
jgi:beta-phosphoglucomutase